MDVDYNKSVFSKSLQFPTDVSSTSVQPTSTSVGHSTMPCRKGVTASSSTSRTSFNQTPPHDKDVQVKLQKLVYILQTSEDRDEKLEALRLISMLADTVPDLDGAMCNEGGSSRFNINDIPLPSSSSSLSSIQQQSSSSIQQSSSTTSQMDSIPLPNNPSLDHIPIPGKGIDHQKDQSFKDSNDNIAAITNTRLGVVKLHKTKMAAIGSTGQPRQSLIELMTGHMLKGDPKKCAKLIKTNKSIKNGKLQINFNEMNKSPNLNDFTKIDNITHISVNTSSSSKILHATTEAVTTLNSTFSKANNSSSNGNNSNVTYVNTRRLEIQDRINAWKEELMKEMDKDKKRKKLRRNSNNSEDMQHGDNSMGFSSNAMVENYNNRNKIISPQNNLPSPSFNCVSTKKYKIESNKLNHIPCSYNETNSVVGNLSISVKSRDMRNDYLWPSELVNWTSTSPSICFSCNPLYFNFSKACENKKVQKGKPIKNIIEFNASIASNAECLVEIKNSCSDGEKKLKNKTLQVSQISENAKPQHNSSNVFDNDFTGPSLGKWDSSEESEEEKLSFYKIKRDNETQGKYENSKKIESSRSHSHTSRSTRTTSRSRSSSYNKSSSRRGSRSYSFTSRSRSRSFTSYSSRSSSYHRRSRRKSYSRSYSKSYSRSRSYKRSYSSSSYSRSRSRSFSRSRSNSSDYKKKIYSKSSTVSKFLSSNPTITQKVLSTKIYREAESIPKSKTSFSNELPNKSVANIIIKKEPDTDCLYNNKTSLPENNSCSKNNSIMSSTSDLITASEPSFIGPTLPSNHPLSQMQEIPLPKVDLPKDEIFQPIGPNDPLVFKAASTNEQSKADKNDISSFIIPPEQMDKYKSLMLQAEKHAKKVLGTGVVDDENAEEIKIVEKKKPETIIEDVSNYNGSNPQQQLVEELYLEQMAAIMGVDRFRQHYHHQQQQSHPRQHFLRQQQQMQQQRLLNQQQRFKQEQFERRQKFEQKQLEEQEQLEQQQLQIEQQQPQQQLNEPLFINNQGQIGRIIQLVGGQQHVVAQPSVIPIVQVGSSMVQTLPQGRTPVIMASSASQHVMINPLFVNKELVINQENDITLQEQSSNSSNIGKSVIEANAAKIISSAMTTITTSTEIIVTTTAVTVSECNEVFDKQSGSFQTIPSKSDDDSESHQQHLHHQQQQAQQCIIGGNIIDSSRIINRPEWVQVVQIPQHQLLIHQHQQQQQMLQQKLLLQQLHQQQQQGGIIVTPAFHSTQLGLPIVQGAVRGGLIIGEQRHPTIIQLPNGQLVTPTIYGGPQVIAQSAPQPAYPILLGVNGQVLIPRFIR